MPRTLLANLRSTRSRSRRGFALPLAVLLALVGGLAIVILLERHSSIRLAYRRQIDSYVLRHESAGIMECVLNWLGTARGQDVLDAVDEEGKAFSMELPGGNILRVYLEDGQGQALRDTSTVAGRRREIAQDMLFILDTTPDEEKGQNLFRVAGPPEVSINAADESVIRALCVAVLADTTKADLTTKSLFRARGSGKLKAADFTTALNAMSLTQQQSQEIASMLVVTPTLLRVVAETRTPGGVLLARSAGLYPLNTTANRSETFKQTGGFISWEALDIDEDRQPGS